MKNIIYILMVLLALQSCKKDGFEYQVYQPTVADIDSIGFSAGSPTLIADGKAALQFVIEAFRTVRLESKSGAAKDTLMFVDYTVLPKEEVKVFVDGQLIDGTIYSTTDLSKTSISCHVQIGNAKSATKVVTIRQPKDAGEKRYVDVIFHVFELSATDDQYDPLTYQSITPKMLQEGIAYVNEIFSNKVGMDPNGGNANVEFRLAKYNATGAALPIPGYNKIQYDASWKTSPTAAYIPNNFKTKIDATPAYQWNKSKFVNIYVLPMPANTNIGTSRPIYQVVPAEGTPIAGIDKVVQSEADVPQNLFYDNYGLALHRTAFFPNRSNRIELASYFASYYATYPTNSSGTTITDYVSDTRKYLTGSSQTANVSTGLMKVSVDGYKFLANNAMDDIRYASLRNSLTQGQVERIRLVMERSPVRKAWSLQ
ncbi:M43 family zinc metalloprotease [Sphingobacterium yanglingense]|uniref:Pregnancy-associated plasma protein-A n=1 Tax=Sphingobacterium yanglingense TaxID=1437280 RepID=A0A4V3DDA4_9SPHI|nr:M43 family zinc metalloprotease [Sphingobacterium yanglingense]TDQ75391.1 pregnancy-associated plasma protein-A [Sphingobacterium yanglingense]